VEVQVGPEPHVHAVTMRPPSGPAAGTTLRSARWHKRSARGAHEPSTLIIVPFSGARAIPSG